MGKYQKPLTDSVNTPRLENTIPFKQRPRSLDFKSLSDIKLQCSFKSLLSPKNKRPQSAATSNRNASSLNSLNDGRIPWPIPWLEAIFLPEFPNRGPLNDKQFEKDGIIAEGKFSTVYKVKLKSRPTVKFAMKVQRKSDILNRQAVDQIKDELRIHQTFCCHPFIAQMYGSWQSRSHVYMVLHYISGYGDLYDYWRFENPLPPNAVKYWAVELGSALDYIHNNGVIYRDMKMENVVLDERAHVKLVDFGLAKWLKRGERTKTICGTLHYMAPETLTGLGYSHSADWWSLGVLLHTLVCGTYPFQVTDERKVKHFVGYRPPVILNFDLQQLLLKLLRFNPLCRLTDFLQYQKEPYFSNVSFEALLTRTLSPADEILSYQQSKLPVQNEMKDQSMTEEECIEDYMEEYTKSTVYKFRKLHPKCFLGISFSVEIPDEDEVQIAMSGVAVTADFVPATDGKIAANDTFRKEAADSSQKSESVQGRCDHMQLGDRVDEFAQTQQKVESGDVFVTALMEPPAGSRIEKYVGYYDFFFIRETGAVREIGGVDSFVQMALSEIITVIRSHVAASGGNGMVSFKFNVSELSDSVGRNQAQFLVSVSGDIVTTV